MTGTITHFPTRLTVSSLESSRYGEENRPASWNDRFAGVDVIKTDDGETLRLLSDGGQSPPRKGWTIMILGGSADEGYRWTLYGLPRM